MQTLLTEWELERASYEGKVLAQAEGTQSAEFWIANAKTKKAIDSELRIISGRIRAGGDAIRLIGDLRRELG